MVIDIYKTDRQYDLLYVDPPWRQTKGGKKAVRPNSSGGGTGVSNLYYGRDKRASEAGSGSGKRE